MSTFTLKLNAAKKSASWQLALDKYPFDVERPDEVWTTRPDNRNQEQPIKPHRLREVRDRYTAAKPSLDAAAKRQQDFLAVLARQHGPRFRRVTLVNSSRLLLHLGRASVLENVGLHCERTTGLPVIPGTAVKGVVSTWACWAENFNEVAGSFRDFTADSMQRRHFTQAESRLAAAILGDNSANGSTAAGEVVFLGAFPKTPPILELDIVTPHTDAAGRDRAPVPNPFLAVAAGTPWEFTLLAAPHSTHREASARLDQAESWLKEALCQCGLGAKTASGYGRFIPQPDWDEATLDEATKAEIAAQKQREDARTANLAAMRATSVGDYANEATFKNMVLAKLSLGQINQLEQEIKKLRENPDNESWRGKLIDALRGKDMKDIRKKLKEKNWFPQDWLPQ